MNATINRQYLLKQRPSGALQESDFAWAETPVPDPGPGGVLVRNVYLSLDPANRGWINDVPTYRAPVPVGGPMAGFTISRVVASNRDDLKPGDFVEGDGGWQAFLDQAGDVVIEDEIDPTDDTEDEAEVDEYLERNLGGTRQKKIPSIADYLPPVETA